MEARQEAGGRTEAETMGEILVNRLALSSLFSLLCYVTQAHLLRNNTAHSGLGPRTSIITQEYSVQECSLANVPNPIPQLKFLFLGYLGLHQVDTNKPGHSPSSISNMKGRYCLVVGIHLT